MTCVNPQWSSFFFFLCSAPGLWREFLPLLCTANTVRLNRPYTHTHAPQRGRLSLGLSSHVTLPAAVAVCSAHFICVHRSVHESVHVLMCARVHAGAICPKIQLHISPRQLKQQSQHSHPLYTAVSAHAIYTSTQ